MNAPALVRNNGLLAAGEIQDQVNVIQHVMKQVMKQDVHYGVIPGCKEKSLYKPGAEKIMAAFRLSADPDITDLSDSDQIRYRVKVKLVSPSGVTVGFGVGECSSSEEKYKWRNAVCPQEFDEFDPSRKREKWVKGWQNKPPFKRQQVRTDPADLANTILKMAKKRALVDGVLTATAASDCFTQDIEDLPPEYINQEVEAEQQSGQEGKRPVFYSEADFQKNAPAWASHIKAGKTTAARVIAVVESKAKLTDQQKQSIFQMENQHGNS